MRLHVTAFILRFLTSLFLLGVAFACVPPSENEEVEGVIVDLNDPVSRLIYEHQNARNVDSLLVYLSHDNASYRYLATRAFGSFPNMTDAAVDALSAQLGCRNELIREAAAYALGQSGLARAADTLTAAFDADGMYRAFNAELLAAVGKTGDSKLQGNISKITTYKISDTLLVAGQAWSLYYFARREIQSPAGDQRMLDLIQDNSAPIEARRPAAFFLQRFKVTADSATNRGLRELLRTNTDPDILMGVVRTIGRQEEPAGRVALLRALRRQTDWRVRTEIIRALSAFDYASVREPIVGSLKDDHPLVRRTAAEFLRDNGLDTDATFYRQLARDSTQNDVRYVLYAAAQRHLPLYFADYRGFLNYDLQQAYAKTTNAYQLADILSALAEYPWNYRNVYELYQKTDKPAVRSAVAEALRTISNREDFNVFFKKSSRRVRYDLSVYFREMIYSTEVGPAYAAASALQDQADVYRPFYTELDWMNTALLGFQLPRDIEGYRAVDGARAALAGEQAPMPFVADGPAKTIDWNIIGTDAGQEVSIRLPGGRVVLRLWPDMAPATVSSFLELVKAGYYNGKVFHRVVPNFVAQGGGPLGDGYGSEEFRLRTETPGARWDRPGLIGMASAGKDTEGVQFFITHRAAPHLDGGYTIFGEVVEGQKVLDGVTIGTVIERVELR
ncbi:MAG: cyclophilin family peptidyl-prolyl cis-trans isomerase/HEAT repeat protein [Neolewinella sp.]|jgi:cyclophilin family peptidyl-prolyl cis-trans isomerase/HEAT repeat protein